MFLIQDEPISTQAVADAVRDPGCGALLIFEGVTRDNFEGRKVRGLQYEAFAELAVPVMQDIAKEARSRWDARVAMVHRTGSLGIGEVSLVIAVSTPHRGECYEASRFAIEEVKRRLPVWKKEVYDDGSAWKPNQP